MGPGRLLASIAARGYLSVMIGLLVWGVAPIAVGWTPSLIVGASMEPRIPAGDVVVFAPVRPSEPAALRPGRVALFDDPARPGRLLTHRVVGRTDDGNLRTKGDANDTEDSTPVPPNAVHGLARLRVPMIGRPMIWFRDGRPAHMAIFVLATTAAVLVAAGDAAIARRGKAARRRSAHATPAGRRLRRTRISRAAQVVIVVVGLTAVSAPPARAAWSASTANPGNSFAAASSFCTSPGNVFVGMSAETFIEQAHPNVNNGSGGDLRVDPVTGAALRSLVGYALPAIPDRCTVTSAQLRLHVKAGHAGRTLVARRAASSWSAGTVTWNTQPATTGTSATAPSAASGSVTFDVTTQVLAQYAGANHGFVIGDPVVTDGHIAQVFYSTATAGVEQAPVLRVTFN